MNTAQLAVGIDADGLAHVALVVTTPVRRRGGRTLPAARSLAGMCTRTATKGLSHPIGEVETDVRAPEVWCQECAGYLDHLDAARAAEVDRLEAVFAAVPVLTEIPDTAAANAANMARLGEDLTGVSSEVLKRAGLDDAELRARAATLRADPSLRPMSDAERMTAEVPGFLDRSVVTDALARHDDRRAAVDELRRLAVEGEAEQ